MANISRGPLEWNEDRTNSIETPAYVLDERRVVAALEPILKARDAAGFQLQFALNASTNLDLLHLLSKHVDGLAASSPFDARLARELLGPTGIVSSTSPAYSETEIDDFAELCDYVIVNSLDTWRRFRSVLVGRTSPGIRINPLLSFKADARYDPARSDSKLGVQVPALRERYDQDPSFFAGLEGLHFHTNCESHNFAEWLATIEAVVSNLRPLVAQLKWINIGGGYVFSEGSDLTPFYTGVSMLRKDLGLPVFIEPGFSIAAKASKLVATVLDILPSSGDPIAVLDTTVNHVPEVFEFQWSPPVVGSDPALPHRYLLAGRSCLNGDRFGTYGFAEPLTVGSRVVFENVGAYAFVKAHTFNGLNLPNLYTITTEGELNLRRKFEYRDYRARLALGGK